MNWKCLYLGDLGGFVKCWRCFLFLIFDERSSSWGGLKDKLIRSESCHVLAATWDTNLSVPLFTWPAVGGQSNSQEQCTNSKIVTNIKIKHDFSWLHVKHSLSSLFPQSLPLKASWHPRKANAQPALNILRLFVERFVASEIKTLRGFTYGGWNGKCQVGERIKQLTS